MNFEYVTYCIITAFGQTATTFTSQNHAAGEFGRCRRILRLCLGLSLLCSAVPFFAIVLFRDTLSGLFTPNAAVIQSAGVRILCILLFEPLCNLYEIPAGVLRGSGHALYPALSTMVGRAHFASPGFTQSSGQNRPSRCSTMRFLFHGQRRLC